MTGFADQMRAINVTIVTRFRDVFHGVATETLRSIQDGSALTGAPGSPVDTDNLKTSWNLSYEDRDTALVATNVEYAPAVEDGIGPHGPVTYGAKNGVGGSHSVRLTAAGMQRIVDAEVEKVAR